MASNSKCVHCGETVYEWTRDCPKCGRSVANPDAPVVKDTRSGWSTKGKYKKTSILPYIIGVVVIAALAVAVFYIKSQIYK